MQPLRRRQLEAGLDHIRHAPREAGTVEMIVRRPDISERQVVLEAELSVIRGLVGDNWRGAVAACQTGGPTRAAR